MSSRTAGRSNEQVSLVVDGRSRHRVEALLKKLGPISNLTEHQALILDRMVSADRQLTRAVRDTLNRTPGVQAIADTTEVRKVYGYHGYSAMVHLCGVQMIIAELISDPDAYVRISKSAIAHAVACRLIAEHNGHPAPWSLFLCGLYANLGIPAFQAYHTLRYAAVKTILAPRSDGGAGMSVAAAERLTLGQDHGQWYSLQLLQYGFRPFLCTTIADHHGDPKVVSVEANLVNFAEAFVHLLGYDYASGGISPEILPDQMKSFKLDKASISEIAPKVMLETKQLLGSAI